MRKYLGFLSQAKHKTKSPRNKTNINEQKILKKRFEDQAIREYKEEYDATNVKNTVIRHYMFYVNQIYSKDEDMITFLLK